MPSDLARVLAASRHGDAAALSEAFEVPRRSPGCGPPYWKSRVIRRQTLGDEDGCGSHGGGADDTA